MKCKSGLTLLELLLVIGIMLTLTRLSGAFYSRFLLQNAMDNTVSQITENLRKAQIYSMAGKGNTTWGVRYQNNQIQLYATDGSRIESFSVNPNINISGLTSIVFSRDKGVPVMAATITVSGNNATKTINVNQLGMVER